MTGDSSVEKVNHLGSGPLVLPEDRADLLREKIQDDQEMMDGMAEEYRELQAEKRQLENELWAAKRVYFIVGALLGGGLIYAL